MTKKQFVTVAKPLQIIINGVPVTGNPKKFSTESYGWNANGKDCGHPSQW